MWIANKQIISFAFAHSDAAAPRRIFGRYFQKNGICVKLKYLTLILSLACPIVVHSANFTHEGEVITSSTTVKTIDCGTYTIDLTHETFPFEYEKFIPSEFQIKGFYGSTTTIAKKAIIRPADFIVPNANDIAELKAVLPKGRTYLPGSVACKGKLLVVSYWSGGNCSECEAFVSFEYSGSELVNPIKVTYSDFKELSK